MRFVHQGKLHALCNFIIYNKSAATDYHDIVDTYIIFDLKIFTLLIFFHSVNIRKKLHSFFD